MSVAVSGMRRRSRRLAERDPRVAIYVAVVLALACIGVVSARYNYLPAVLPVTRWTSSAKSPFVAVRVPVINALSTVGLAAIWTAFDRAGFPRVAGFIMIAAAGLKSIGEALELLMLPDKSWVTGTLIAATIVTSIAVALVTSRCWLRERGWKLAQWTPLLATIAIGAVVGIVGLNLVAATCPTPHGIDAAAETSGASTRTTSAQLCAGYRAASCRVCAVQPRYP